MLAMSVLVRLLFSHGQYLQGISEPDKRRDPTPARGMVFVEAVQHSSNGLPQRPARLLLRDLLLFPFFRGSEMQPAKEAASHHGF